MKVEAMPNEKPPLERSTEILGGALVFAGTRVPVQTLLDYLQGGDRLDDFLADFPTVAREQAVSALERVRETPPEDDASAD